MKEMKMRVNTNKDSKCEFCGESWKNVEEMYDLKIGEEKSTMCRHCEQQLFLKLLTADCKYIGKIKDKEDIDRSNRYHERLSKGIKAKWQQNT